MAELTSLSELTATPHARPFGGGEPAVVRLALEAGERVDPHRHPDRRVVILVRSGLIELTLDDEQYTLEADDLIRFDGRREVSPAAVEDSEALVLLAARPEHGEE